MSASPTYAEGTILRSRRVEMDDDDGRQRYTPAGSTWRVVRIEGELHDIVCDANGAAVRPTLAELERDFDIIPDAPILPEFYLSEAQRAGADGMRVELRVGAYDLAERLGDLGLSADKASTVVVDWLIEQACTMAMAVAVAQGRRPEKARWQAVTGDKFDRVRASFASIIDGRRAP